MGRIFEAMHKSGATLAAGGFLDLKNRKQLGDLTKSILNLRQKSRSQAFIFASCRPKEGVSTVVANLVDYFQLYQPTCKVLVIDANLHAPSLHHMLGLRPGAGLAEVLLGSTTLGEAIQDHEPQGGIQVLSCGEAYHELAGNVMQGRVAALLSEARERYDCILIDSSPIMSSTDTLSIAAAADGLFLVVHSLKVQAEVALKAKALLHNNECVVCGVVLNRVLQVIPEWMYRLI